jgi:hypothetical protein
VADTSDLSGPIEDEKQSIVRQGNPQEDKSEPKARADRAEVPRSHPTENESAKETKDAYERQRNGLMVLTLLVSSFALTVSIFSLRTAEKTFHATRRAAIYLGTPDGRVSQWITERGRSHLVLYFRNYGPTAGQKFMVETWPIVTVSQRGFETTTKISPPVDLVAGPSIPPGFTYVARLADPGVTQEELDAGQKGLRIVGRVRYADPFDRYCEDFFVAYSHSLSQFILTTPVSADLCDTNEDTIQTLTTVTDDGKIETLFSPYRAR